MIIIRLLCCMKLLMFMFLESKSDFTFQNGVLLVSKKNFSKSFETLKDFDNSFPHLIAIDNKGTNEIIILKHR